MLHRLSSGRKRAVVALPLFIFSLGLSQPVDGGKQFRPPDLVEIVKLDSSIKLDIRYATTNNFMHRKMYTQARAFLQRQAAKALIRANARLHTRGYGLVVLDAYRPWSVTKKFWDETLPDRREYVANPKTGSRHNRGCAVDLTLYLLSTGGEVSMPTNYDDFSSRASPEYGGGTQEQRRARDVLRRALENEGFTVEKNEWWHFNYKGWQSYQILNIPFAELN